MIAAWLLSVIITACIAACWLEVKIRNEYRIIDFGIFGKFNAQMVKQGCVKFAYYKSFYIHKNMEEIFTLIDKYHSDSISGEELYEQVATFIDARKETDCAIAKLNRFIKAWNEDKYPQEGVYKAFKQCTKNKKDLKLLQQEKLAEWEKML